MQFLSIRCSSNLLNKWVMWSRSLFKLYFTVLFCSLFLWILCIKQGIKYDSSTVLQLEMCESLWECGGVQNLPSLCERLKKQVGGSEYVWTIYVLSRYIPPHPPTNHCSGSLGVYYTVRQILSMNITPIPLLTPTVSGDCYEPVMLTRNKVVVKATEKKKKKSLWKGIKKNTPNLTCCCG